MRAILPLGLAVALAACGSAPDAGSNDTATPPPPVDIPAATSTPAPTGTASSTPDYIPPSLTPEAARGEKGARNVLLSWAHAVEDRAFAAAYGLYGPNGAPDGQTEKQFAAGFAAYETITATLGDGEVEGAAGSSYYEVPVTLSGTAHDGAAYKRGGTITVRRVNDVPGAAPWQLAWHVERIAWQD